MIHTKLRALYSDWEALRAGRPAPMRADIDPRAMTSDLRHLFILEDLGRGNVRFRVAGTALIDAFGMELRGLNIRAVMAAASRESFSALVDEVLEDPGIGYARLRDATNDAALWEINLLPLRSDFGAIDRIVGCLHPLTEAAAEEPGRPLRFRIDHMSVDPVIATVIEEAGPTPAPAFAEPAGVFSPAPPSAGNGPRLRAIDGGRGPDGAGWDRETRTRGHLRLVED